MARVRIGGNGSGGGAEHGWAGAITSDRDGRRDACAIIANGAARCCGDGSSGRLGTRVTITQLRPVIVPSFTPNTVSTTPRLTKPRASESNRLDPSRIRLAPRGTSLYFQGHEEGLSMEPLRHIACSRMLRASASMIALSIRTLCSAGRTATLTSSRLRSPTTARRATSRRSSPRATARWSSRSHASTTSPAITSPNVGVRNTSESRSLYLGDGVVENSENESAHDESSLRRCDSRVRSRRGPGHRAKC